MNERKSHNGTTQPAATVGKMVTVWFEDDADDLDKKVPIEAESVDWDFPGDPVVSYRVEP